MMNEAKRKLLGSIGLMLVALAYFGCWSKKEDPKRDAEPSKFDGIPLSPPNVPGAGQDTNQSTVLRSALIGKWQLLGGNWKGSTIEFTQAGGFQIGLKWIYSKEPEDKFGRYSLEKDVVKVGPENGPWNSYRPEFHSDNEMTLHHSSKYVYRGFEQLEGRWKRIGERETSGPIADAKRQVQSIATKLTKLEAIQKAAFADRDELVARLRALGVNSVADLKGNIRGQRIAENLAKLATEIEGRDRQLAVIDTELLKAKSIVRRMEQEQAGLSEAEMLSLALQLKEVTDRTDGPSLPLTPIDVDSAVEKALKSASIPK
jgi:hypothetical protein